MAKCGEEGCGKPQRIVYHGKPFCWECFDKQATVSTKQEQETAEQYNGGYPFIV